MSNHCLYQLYLYFLQFFSYLIKFSYQFTIIFTMGNTACCDQQTKGGQLKEKMKLRLSMISQQRKFNNINSIVNSSNPKNDKNEQSLKIEQSLDKVSILDYQLDNLQKEADHNQLPIISKERLISNNHKGQPKRQDIEQQLLEETPILPQLNKNVKKTLDNNNFFKEQFKFSPNYKIYDEDFYEGQLDKQKKYPNGYGKFYKKDESFYIGQFAHGKAQGQGAYIFKDGSYYKGQFKNNSAYSEKGLFKANDFQYEGGFKNNKFHGHGKEKGKAHQFEGQYYDGNKTNGRLKWTDQKQSYEYEGAFNDKNEFHGAGTLIEPNGSYKGEFIKGNKHGKGTYKYANGLKYIGQYNNGLRDGKGTLFNSNNKIAYQGQFSKGLPHGKGHVQDKQGNKLQTSWIQGIDSQCL